MIDEYSMLREEIILSMKTVKNYNNVLYTATVALLAFAFNFSDSALYLLPFIVVIPLYFLKKREMIQALRIGAYILVFLEKNSSIKWESRLNMYDALFRKNSHKHIPLNAYLGISFLCISLSVANTDYSVFDSYNITLMIIQIILSIVSLVAFGFLSPNYISIKSEYIKQWTKIKTMEETEKIKSEIIHL